MMKFCLCILFEFVVNIFFTLKSLGDFKALYVFANEVLVILQTGYEDTQLAMRP